MLSSGRPERINSASAHALSVGVADGPLLLSVGLSDVHLVGVIRVG